MARATKVLIVAGTDPTGGAGIVRDIETACHFATPVGLAVTSVNVQDDYSVTKKMPVTPDIISGQMLAALHAGHIAAIKVGMTGTVEIVKAICRVLVQFSTIPVVLDPVITASSGGALADAATVKTIIRDFIKHCYLLTPNLIELAQLTGTSVSTNHDQSIDQAKKLVARGTKYVLVKGGHEKGEFSTDSLVSSDKVTNFSFPRLHATMRGTGCLLSTAIACQIARGEPVENAVKIAKTYVYQLLKQRKTLNEQA